MRSASALLCFSLALLAGCQVEVTAGGNGGAGGSGAATTSSAATGSSSGAATGSTGGGGAGPACKADGALCWRKEECCANACSGRFCGAGAGACQPGDAPVVLATNAAGIFTLAIDADHVYFTTPQGDGCTDKSQVLRIPKQGGAPEVVGTPQRVPSVLAVDDTNIYWPDEPWDVCEGTNEPGYSLFITPKGSGSGWATQSVAPYYYPATGIAVDDTHVFWVNPSSYVFRAAKISGSAVPLGWMENWPESIALDDTSVYWSCDLGIRRLPKTGGLNPETLAPQEFGSAQLAVDADALYVAKRVVVDINTSDTELWRLSKDGAAMTKLATIMGQEPGHIALDDTSIYWTVTKPYSEGPPHLGQVLRIPKTGGTPVQIALGTQPNALAVDDSCVYWNDGTDLMKAPK